MGKENIAIIVPLYNDWESYDCLLRDIKQLEASHSDIHIDNFVVDDSSSIIPEHYNDNIKEVIRLNSNIGHQRAICIGLSYLSANYAYDCVIVMDADGEDKVADINTLFAEYKKNGNNIIFARRTKRHEGLSFRLFYFIYKFIFYTLTGNRINFGNFCLIPGSVAKRLVNVSDIWNHFACGIMRSKIRYTSLDIERGVRYKGVSKMNFTTLVIHGLSAVSVFMDKVAIRLIFTMSIAIVVAILGILVVSFFKIFTDMAIPGWATSAVVGFIIIMLQSVLVILFMIFMILNGRNQRLLIPIRDYKDFIDRVINVKS